MRKYLVGAVLALVGLVGMVMPASATGVAGAMAAPASVPDAVAMNVATLPAHETVSVAEVKLSTTALCLFRPAGASAAATDDDYPMAAALTVASYYGNVPAVPTAVPRSRV